MRTCCTCPDQAGLHAGGAAGPLPDFSRPSASATSCRPGRRSEPVGSTRMTWDASVIEPGWRRGQLRTPCDLGGREADRQHADQVRV